VVRPEAVGVPVIRPVTESSDKPAGSVVGDTKAYDVIDPDPGTVVIGSCDAVSATFTGSAPRFAGAIISGASYVASLNVLLTFTPKESVRETTNDVAPPPLGVPVI
jgi:hypothetical protein